ncbi:branched-chain amino acid ABC transporter permease [Salarchaeum sp. JOR-1]|uniref:branched-chain amino acid ABC transporter permease n=1 Tax=Salarchaeum sp. JOR-1 TaxID=2599399 RepID=UPI0011985E71|nr:branched-chain amino acid ABC transporter permease [Salarchaeum sp. JOR-1]QDX41481.1 branched-chain amino acid ABC transporter permease [Salarchaeum sp. JOR-1]
MSETEEPSLLTQVVRNDAFKVTVLFAAIWALFYALSAFLGYPTYGVVATLRRVTFLAAVYAIAVLALNIQWGYTGLFNIGVAGFMAVGAYTTVILSANPGGSPPGLGLPLPVGVLGGILAAVVIGLVAALPALRLDADYLAIVTVAFSEIIRLTLNSPVLIEITGGASGFDNLPTSPVQSLLLSDPGSIISEPTAIGAFVFGLGEPLGLTRIVLINVVYTVGVLVVLLLVYLLLERAGKSPFGRVLKAIREDEVAAQSLGKNTQSFKVRAFALGCGLMGLAGILWYAMGPRASVVPANFRPELTFYIFIALIIGGAGSNTGSIIGGAVFASLLYEAPPLLSDVVVKLLADYNVTLPSAPGNVVTTVASADPLAVLAFLLANIDTLRFIFMGVLLVLLVQYKPDGLLGDRTETAAAVPISEDSRPAGSDAGGETDE